MFDNISEAAWLWTWEGGSAWCLSGTCHLTYSKIDLSLLQASISLYLKISMETWETPHFPASSLLGILGPGDRRL